MAQQIRRTKYEMVKDTDFETRDRSQTLQFLESSSITSKIQDVELQLMRYTHKERFIRVFSVKMHLQMECHKKSLIGQLETWFIGSYIQKCYPQIALVCSPLTVERAVQKAKIHSLSSFVEQIQQKMQQIPLEKEEVNQDIKELEDITNQTIQKVEKITKCRARKLRQYYLQIRQIKQTFALKEEQLKEKVKVGIIKMRNDYEEGMKEIQEIICKAKQRTERQEEQFDSQQQELQ